MAANNNYLYNTRAHVFQINPETRNSWLPKGETAIPISFVGETQPPTSKRELKIIGTNEDGEIVLESVILQKTQFTKRSQKFGQWTDHTGMVYGLGFNSEAELNDFLATFQELQRNFLSPQSQLSTVAAAAAAAPVGVSNNQADKTIDLLHKVNVGANSVGPANNATVTGWNKSQEHINNVSESGINGDVRNSSLKSGDVPMAHPGYSNTLAHPGHQQAQIRRQQPAQQVAEYPHNNSNNNNNNGVGNTSNNGINDNGGYPRAQSMFGLQAKTSSVSSDGRASPDAEGTTISQGEWQMRANNLKQQNNLVYENERLKQALEESSKNASVWANELSNLRTNNGKLTQALQESKAHVEEWERELLGLRDENKELKLRVMALESANDSEKGNEYKMDLQKYKNYVEDIQSELRKKDNEIDELQRSMEQMEIKAQQQNQNGRSDEANAADKSVINFQQKQRLESVNAKLDAKINELANVQRELAQLLENYDE